jgi:hypothetical protein
MMYWMHIGNTEIKRCSVFKGHSNGLGDRSIKEAIPLRTWEYTVKTKCLKNKHQIATDNKHF